MMRVVEIDRDMDRVGISEMEELFDDIARGSDDVCLDLSRVEFLDSAGVAGMVELFRRLRRRSLKFAIIHAQEQPLHVLNQVLKNRRRRPS